MGGDDSENNLIDITVEKHAEEHKRLYELYSKTEDYIAWRGLAGTIGKEEIFKETSSLGGLKNKGKPKTAEHKKKISEAISGLYLDETVKAKISKSMLGNTNSKKHSSKAYRKAQSKRMVLWHKKRRLEKKNNAKNT